MKRLSISFYFVLFFSVLNSFVAYGQGPGYPCDDITIFSLLPGLSFEQVTFSSVENLDETDVAGLLESSEEGGYFKTQTEMEPWIEFDLGKSMHPTEFMVWYPQEGYELNDFYFLTSDLPFPSNDLEALIASDEVMKFHVLSNAPPGSSFELQDFKGRYVRIQQSGYGELLITGIDIPGYGENCSNGEDDDCDGDIDCDDSDCAPKIINIVAIPPSCPICPDGKITVQATQYDIEYSKDGGITYVPFNPISPTSSIHVFENLVEDEYTITVRNEICDVYHTEYITLLAPLGNPTEGCENGGFENGDFNEWIGMTGIWSTGLNTTGISPTHHTILSGGMDPFIPLAIPFLGTYSARLGSDNTIHNSNLQDDGSIQSLTYNFVVDDDNANFNFSYAMVMEDPGHDSGANPYFSYRIYYFPTPGNQQTILTSGKLIADLEDPFFKVIPKSETIPTDIVYKGWTCDGFDLSNFIGEEVYIEFEAGNCLPGPHFGYAYIDGICTSTEGAKPLPVINSVSEIFCMNQVVEVDGRESSRFNQFRWEVCKLDNMGGEIDCRAEDDFTIDYTTGILDVGDFYSELGGAFECGYDYKVSLTLKNDCTEDQTESQVISFVCDENEVEYQDIAICSEEDFTLEGINDCLNCEVEWLPSSSFYDNTIPFPTTNASINVLAYSQNFNVSVSNEVGCIYTDEVKTLKFSDIIIEFEETNKTFCDFVAGAKIISPIDLNSNSISIKLHQVGTNFYDQGAHH